VKKKEIREQADKCDTSAKVSTYSELENVLFAWYHQAKASGIPVDGSILWEKSLKIAATMGIENSWISCFKQCLGVVFKKLARECCCGRQHHGPLVQEASKDAGGVRGSIMQMKPASFSIACQTECWH
jgi:hypothetical protein